MDFDTKLCRLAELALKVGVNLQSGQELIVTAPIEANALVHHITAVAYRLGAKHVTCLYDDPRMIQDRFRHANDASFDYAPAWLSRGVAEALRNGAARLYVVAPYPDLLTGVSPEKIVRTHTSMGKASGDETSFTSQSLINWSTIPFVTASWARTVFPGVPVEQATRKLWDAVFDVTRVDDGDAILPWQHHNRALGDRRDALQRKQFSALRFHDGQTDLRVGLADGHRWVGGSVIATNGVECICNIPTEEVFTCPHRERTNGHAFFSKSLVLAGTRVEGVRVEFCDGALVSLQASTGQEMIEKLIAADEGARRLGEVGLVPNSSLIARSNTLFYNPLFDENAASHIAFGQSYAACLTDGSSAAATPIERGANQSGIHIDCMIGNGKMNVDGIHASGTVEAVMRDGEFVI